MSNWSLVTYRSADCHEHAGIRRADGAIVAPSELDAYSGAFDALQDWADLSESLKSIDPEGLDEVSDAVEILSLRFPRKVVCAGANYLDHIAEMGDSDVPSGWRPFFFLLPPTTALIGNGDVIEVPYGRKGVDWEAELAIVIGSPATRIDPADAFDHIAGYACLNDVTTRTALRRDVALAPPFQWDWAESKASDTFTPLGPVTPAWQVADPNALGIKLWVNDVLKQDGNTRDLICSLAEVVAAASHLCTLEPGDVIATGTPAGVGAARGEELHDGDTVRIEIEGLAPLTNSVRVHNTVQRAGRQSSNALTA
ncbi:MAG: fumarylacetoacetate hydrolase family protein [Rhodococcus sp. (in: high G+C Gram-positive bacteria)]|uniref:fumarylacetoacetate hydrolase family protein n=1 Tax=Rhodococcus sp. TaxID=1831 RepID=UPI002AD5BE72|nr:fumarylacetoacetate hydrolase family protein [Rhodococcus sp. (in: high G+C Gram-positive bacteria)]